MSVPSVDSLSVYAVDVFFSIRFVPSFTNGLVLGFRNLRAGPQKTGKKWDKVFVVTLF
jgi:hypothetical protein